MLFRKVLIFLFELSAFTLFLTIPVPKALSLSFWRESIIFFIFHVILAERGKSFYVIFMFLSPCSEENSS